LRREKTVEPSEWGNAEQIFERFGLSKGTLLKLASQGRIKTVRLKLSPEARKSVKLFSIESIRVLLEQSLS